MHFPFFQNGSIKSQLACFARDLNLTGDVFSLKPFKDTFQGLKVFGCFTIAAAVIPQILCAILNPLSFLLIGLGTISVFKSLKGSDESKRKLRNEGLTLIGLGVTLPLVNQMLGFIMAAVFIYRSSNLFYQMSSNISTSIPEPTPNHP